jgi:hypothetical protein
MKYRLNILRSTNRVSFPAQNLISLQITGLSFPECSYYRHASIIGPDLKSLTLKAHCCRADIASRLLLG